ncbi:CcoQ/FixQ family Cbb3-type cytochrome c oxidase assembly chaperone [Lysobacter sp. SG-8]|uniref:CcoQ/FixQ family Cbb3-type cytochrome c oxidase assembly chaperone n=1 Tax=Marilutibacter penaei TaxID=2759900 RepID=A0A7W3YE21_9GAMM|nr:CcoQ/FixQ family Cbb3-type cytochrome c oxidase assembly chaperone [Lysobacter penaei]MBB1087855.1 CcoQ/FixQ family Cbb3-type cytochrome c oxidase assembly chaperone [Lysobacter penaei]
MVSGIVTLVLLVLFVGGWIHLWNPKLKPELEAAARLPFDEGEPLEGPEETQ